LQIISWFYETLAPYLPLIHSRPDGCGLSINSRCGTQLCTVRARETVRSSSEKSAYPAEEQSEDKAMAATTTTGFSIPASKSAIPVACVRTSHRRNITPQAGRALDLLAHAIEYLTDEFVHQGVAYSAKNEQLEAVQTLMALNRQVYFECPEVPSFGERCRALLHLHAA
jgi:hypothetical protein